MKKDWKCPNCPLPDKCQAARLCIAYLGREEPLPLPKSWQKILKGFK